MLVLRSCNASGVILEVTFARRVTFRKAKFFGPKNDAFFAAETTSVITPTVLTVCGSHQIRHVKADLYGTTQAYSD